MARTLSNEVWRPVLGWPDYEVSSDGRVRGRFGPIKTFVVKGYPAFNVVRGVARKSLRLHREVLRAFAGDRPGMVVCHNNGNPHDCRLANLRWDTYAGNESDKSAHGTKMEGESHHQHVLTSEDVRSIRSSREPSKLLAEKFGVSAAHVRRIRRGSAWRCLT